MSSKTILPQIACIEKLSHDGRGIAYLDKKVIFIEGTLIGEKVSFQRLRKKKDYEEGRLLEVLEASPLRVNPSCVHFMQCGGCSFQHLGQSDQLQAKQAWLLDALQRIGHCTPEELLPPMHADAWHYRSKARLSVRYVEKKQEVLIGFREKHKPQFVMDMKDCAILIKKVSEYLPELRILIGGLTEPKDIVQIEVAGGDEGIALIIRHLSALSQDEQEKIRQFGEKHQFLMVLQGNGKDQLICLQGSEEKISLHYRLPKENLRYRFQPQHFTQVNQALNQLLVEKVLHLMDLQADDVVLDLFCGLGNFSLPMAKYCAKVIGIEGEAAMVEQATENAKANGLSNAFFMKANLENLAELKNLGLEGVNKLLIDPPRSGAFELVKQIEWFNAPARLIYVSCNPATLARDAGVLVHQKGYRLKKVGVLDMFPQTAHVEAIALFEKGK